MSVALVGALAVGVSLGLLGSGGSILTVPILVYLLARAVTWRRTIDTPPGLA